MVSVKLIDLLNEALQMEYSDIFLYPREADILKNREIVEKFEKFGRMEIRHADNIAQQIIALGGKPNWEFKPLEIKNNLDEILLCHINQERNLVHFYTNLMDVAAGENQEQLELILSGIKAEEDVHLQVLKEFLRKGK